MQKEFYFDIRPQSDIWDVMWTDRTIDDEVKACDLETPARDLFLALIPKGGRVIDGGCGFAKWVIYLRNRGYDIIGVDNNEIAIAKLKEHDSSLPVELGDILDIQYPDSSFDAYISMGVVEHFEGGPLPALKEAHRVLKPGGLIFVSVPTVNILRKFVRRPLRILINFVPRFFIELRANWSKSKRSAILALLGTIASIMPQRVVRILVRILLRQKEIYYQFLEYRYSKSEVENFLKQSGFEVIKTVPHDLYGANGHSAGLMVDFPFLAAHNAVNFKLNFVGNIISRALNRISPWIACSSVLCVAKAQKM
ncbi:MAG TPA: class I SAM-dependent methyltransferase [Dehalococcoidia bacterium]|nr:class I SAM-dependent methyltransferase [Dehalococcoidia bacterium]